MTEQNLKTVYKVLERALGKISQETAPNVFTIACL